MDEVPGGGAGIDGTRERRRAGATGDLDAVATRPGRREVNPQDTTGAMLPYELAEISQHTHVSGSELRSTPNASMLRWTATLRESRRIPLRAGQRGSMGVVVRLAP